MVRLQLVEDTSDRLSFRMGALAFIGQMTLATLISLVVATALTLFLRRRIGIFFALLFFAVPGLFFAVCGIFGCFNARGFTFTFDRPHALFEAVAGSARISVPFARIILVYIERECQTDSGMFSGNAPPTYSVTLLLADGSRCHLEGGVAVEGIDRGPAELHAHCERICGFIGLPAQPRVPLLELTKNAKPEPANDAQSQERLSRWLSCAGIAPKLEPPLYEYNWLDPPHGVPLPRPPPRPFDMGQGQAYYNQAPTAYVQTSDLWNSRVGGPTGQASMASGNGPVVMGRVCAAQQPLPRQAQVIVPHGMQGQMMQVQAPDGTMLQVRVPTDIASGETITLQY